MLQFCYWFHVQIQSKELRNDLIPRLCLCSTKDENEAKVNEASVEPPGAGFLDPQMPSFISIAHSSF